MCATTWMCAMTFSPSSHSHVLAFTHSPSSHSHMRKWRISHGTHTGVCHDIFTCVSWLFHTLMCAKTYSYLWHDSFTHTNGHTYTYIYIYTQTHTYIYVHGYIDICIHTCAHIYKYACMTYSYVCHDIHTHQRSTFRISLSNNQSFRHLPTRELAHATSPTPRPPHIYRTQNVSRPEFPTPDPNTYILSRHILCIFSYNTCQQIWRHVRPAFTAYKMRPTQNFQTPTRMHIYCMRTYYYTNRKIRRHVRHVFTTYQICPAQSSRPLTQMHTHCVHKYVHVCMNIIHTGWRRLIGPLSCRSFSTKEPLNIGHFCEKWPLKIRYPMSIRHPVSYNTYYMKHIDMNIIHIILISKILTSCPCCIYHTMDASRPKFPTTDPQCTYYIYISTNPSSHASHIWCHVWAFKGSKGPFYKI